MIDEDAPDGSREARDGGGGDEVIGEAEIEAIRAEVAGEDGNATGDEDAEDAEITEADLEWGGSDADEPSGTAEEEPVELDLTDPTDGEGLEPLDDQPFDGEEGGATEDLGGGGHGVPDTL